MENVGNKKLNEYWEANLPAGFKRPNGVDVNAMKNFIVQKYVTQKFIPKDRSILPPHKAFLLKSGPSPEPASKREVAPQPKSKPVPQPKMGARAISRQQSNDVDDAIGGIVSGTSGRSKIRVRHSRHAKETAVAPQKTMHKSQSTSAMQKTAPTLTRAVSDDIDDFFNEPKPVAKPKPKQAAPKPAPPKPKAITPPVQEEVEEEEEEKKDPLASNMQLDFGGDEDQEDIDDFFNETKQSAAPKKTVEKPKEQKPVQQLQKQEVVEEQEEEEKVDPLSKDIKFDLGSDDDKEDVDDFFNDDDEEEEKEHEIKQLPPLQSLSTAPPPIKKPVLATINDSSNPFIDAAPRPNVAPVQQQKKYDDDAPNPFAGAPAQKKPSVVVQKKYDDDAPNPFLNAPAPKKEQEEEIEEEKPNDRIAMPDVEDDDAEDIDDFFGEGKPKEKVPPKPQEPAKPKMETCGYVPSAEVYHPRNPDPPEFVQKMSAGLDVAKEKASEAFDFVKSKLSSLFNNDEKSTTTQNPMVAQRPAAAQPILGATTPQPMVKPRPKIEDEDIDDFFGEPKPKPAPRVQPRQESKPGGGKTYKIHKRGTPQNTAKPAGVAPAPAAVPSKIKKQAAPLKEEKETSVDDAIEFLVGESNTSSSSSSQRRRHRITRH